MAKIDVDEESISLWELLIENHIVEETVLTELYEAHLDTGQSLYKILINSGLIEEDVLLGLFADFKGQRVVDLSHFDASEELLAKVPFNIARMYSIIPYEFVDGKLGLVAVDALSYKLDELRYVLGVDVYVLIAKPVHVQIAVDHYYPNVNDLEAELLEELEIEEIVEEREEDLEVENETSIISFVDAVLRKAIREKASDIHFEPFAEDYKIRCRIDGALYEVHSPPKSLQAAICSRIKVLSNLNVSERRIPQDGRIDYHFQKRSVDMRVSTLPTQYGESVCIRVLDRENTTLALDTLGFSDKLKKSLNELIRKPNGIFIVTGPTGSGKSTTLYSCLNEINNQSTKILTAEDPIEYDIEGIMQVGVKENIGLTYASVLRAFLRQDPDRIMVGEVRDSETANIAIQAALTGHAVYTTLHTNDAPGAIARLLDMGIKSFLLAASIVGVLGQRLLRRICPECSTSYKPRKKELEDLELHEEDCNGRPFYYGKGCEACNYTGYKGRVPLHELFEISPGIKTLIAKGAPAAALKSLALKEGMTTMRNHGVEEIFNGSTTVEEVLKYT